MLRKVPSDVILITVGVKEWYCGLHPVPKTPSLV